MSIATIEQRLNLDLLSDRSKEELLLFYEFLLFKDHDNNAGEKQEPVLRIHEELSRLETTSLVHLEKEFENYKEQYPHETVSGM